MFPPPQTQQRNCTSQRKEDLLKVTSGHGASGLVSCAAELSPAMCKVSPASLFMSHQHTTLLNSFISTGQPGGVAPGSLSPHSELASGKHNPLSPFPLSLPLTLPHPHSGQLAAAALAMKLQLLARHNLSA
ncbi:uncharacterized protein LOC134846408 [Symsagittifera roscoffensis]|uniref:uncharacterized protein LOC134846408 n=1 Tax=Symsagittifera roscoffensis TaxID=84072 RepID=UPI00307CAAE8